jgi:O-antigen/teichoic acid export membrane protein
VATVLRTVIGTAALFAGYGLIGLAGTSLLINLVTAGLLAALTRPWLGTQPTPATTHPARATHPAPTGLENAEPASSAHAEFSTGAHAEPSTNTHAEPVPSYRHWIHQSWPLFLNQLLQGLFFKIDALLLLPLGGSLAAGAYAAAYKVSEGAGIVSSSFTLALFPRLSRGADNLGGAYRLALRTLLQIAFPLAVGIALLSEPIVALVGGRDYLPDSAIALSILIAYLPLSYANGLTQYVLIAARRQRLLTAAFVAALIFNTVANLLLIPRFTYVGAAWVTVLSEVVLLVPFQWAAARAAPNVSLVGEARTPILATLLMAPVVWWVRDAIGPVAAIAAGAVVYPLALWAMGGISAEQIGLALQIAGRGRRSDATPV